MKTLLSTFALTLAFVFTGPAFTRSTFAGLVFTTSAFASDWRNAKTEGDCLMANGTWDDKTKTCKKR